MLKRKKTKPAFQTTTLNKNEVVQLYRQALLAGIPLDVIHQKVNTAAERAQITARAESEHHQKIVKEYRQQIPLSTRFAAKVIPPLCIVIGLFLVGSALVPITSYFLFTLPDLRQANLLAPVPDEQVLDVMPKVVTQVQATDANPNLEATPPSPTDPSSADAPVISPTIDNTELDYTNLSNWFPNLQLPLPMTPSS